MSGEQAAFSWGLIESDDRACQEDMLFAESGAQQTACGTIAMPTQRCSAPASWPAVTGAPGSGRIRSSRRRRSHSIGNSASSPLRWRAVRRQDGQSDRWDAGSGTLESGRREKSGQHRFGPDRPLFMARVPPESGEPHPSGGPGRQTGHLLSASGWVGATFRSPLDCGRPRRSRGARLEVFRQASPVLCSWSHARSATHQDHRAGDRK
jgi:hypothetical protein